MNKSYFELSEGATRIVDDFVSRYAPVLEPIEPSDVLTSDLVHDEGYREALAYLQAWATEWIERA